MPVNSEQLTEFVTDEAPSPGAKRVTLLSGDGRALETGYIGSVLTPGARQITGHIPHWATCPKASDFRKPEQPNPWRGEPA
jgi:hypothetical protein